ncbi:MAG: HTTM domain-containing protein [Gemmatales bacterium]|nr:HTTM domain-containing protein [Gemmatales bacterium]MDW7995945.1 HTTM domain-containing protein [Gemmatales bacterium]
MWRSLVQPIRDYFRELGRYLGRGWDHFWFAPGDPTAIAVVRILTGTILVYIHLVTLSIVLDLIGAHAWVDLQAIHALRSGAHLEELRQKNPRIAEDIITPMFFSVYYYLPQQNWLILTVHCLFLLAMITFTLGLFTRLSNFLAWLGHLSYITRGFTTWFGLDTVILMLSFYLLFTDSGATLSLDSLLRAWRQRSRGSDWRELLLAPAPPSWSANFATRLIQVHLCIIYACAGLAKLQGGTWWAGTAVWITMMTEEFTPMDFQWLAHLGRHTWWWLSAILTAFTIFLEVSFPFLIWTRFWRPILLFLALLLHGGIGFIMGLGSFQVAMLTACAAFISPEGWRWFLSTLLRYKEPTDGDRVSGHPRHQGERIPVPA